MKVKIGDTPMIKIKYKHNGKEKHIFTKLEYYNFSGSIKDRVAEYIINNAVKMGTLKRGMTIYEASSGNTGISLAAISKIYGYNVHIFMPDWVSSERKKIIEMYGAKVTLVSKEEGGFKKCLELAKEEADKNGGFLANQFENKDNILAHYETTGKEIVKKLSNIDGFVSGIGTGGTLMGIAKRLKEYNKNIKVVALEPKNMPLISQNKIISNHKIEGIGDDFIPKIVDKNAIDDIYLIDDEDAINMSKKLSKDLGIGVGISSGANMLAAIMLKEQVENNVVTVFADDNKKYLSTDLSKPINNDEKLLSNKIELIDFCFV